MRALTPAESMAANGKHQDVTPFTAVQVQCNGPFCRAYTVYALF